MDYSTFKAMVADTLNKGTTLDSAIDQRVKQAMLWLERNHPHHYMHRWVNFTIDSTASNPRVIVAPTRVRSYTFFRLVLDEDSDGNSEFEYLIKINPLNVEDVPTGRPTQFWNDGDVNLILNSTPDIDYSAEIGYYQLTDRDALVDASTHWLIDNAEDVLLAQTVLLMTPYLKETLEFFQIWKLLRDEGLRTLQLLEDDFDHGPTESMKMGVYSA